jgi:hypothetical protein
MKNRIPVNFILLTEYERLLKDSLWININRNILTLRGSIMHTKMCSFFELKKRLVSL